MNIVHSNVVWMSLAESNLVNVWNQERFLPIQQRSSVSRMAKLDSPLASGPCLAQNEWISISHVATLYGKVCMEVAGAGNNTWHYYKAVNVLDQKPCEGYPVQGPFISTNQDGARVCQTLFWKQLKSLERFILLWLPTKLQNISKLNLASTPNQQVSYHW